MNVITIPVRLESSRFPNKVIQDIHGKSVMQWIWEACIPVVGADNVYFNTPNPELIEFAQTFGAKAVLTKRYNCVLDQCSEAIRTITEENYLYDTVTVVQGDEPMITSEMIAKGLNTYLDKKRSQHNIQGSCLYKEISYEEAQDINTVKCVISKNFNGLKIFTYFSRSVVPGVSPEKYGKKDGTFNKQVCIFTFSVYTLRNWWDAVSMDDVESSEGIDLLRFVQNGLPILAIESTEETQALDTPEDLFKIRELMSNVVSTK